MSALGGYASLVMKPPGHAFKLPCVEPVAYRLTERVSARLDLVREGRTEVNDDAAMGRFVLCALAATPQVVGISIVGSDLSVHRYNCTGFRSYDFL
ncbi:hypothetical protein [uncultured Enterovirga sp.]|uniref:hypothetical protein n=1 Tax=uncultured Enterovirga sp. TaxID=2026352 RepID=UPI0035CB364D